MSDWATSDAFDRLLGYSQTYLDRVHKAAKEYRDMLDARGPQPPWEPAESDSDFSDAAGAPPSPPPSPRPEGPNLSRGAWSRRILADLAKRIEPRDSGFDNYDRWRSQMMSEYSQKVPSTLEQQAHPTVAVPERRMTRSRVSEASSFYALGPDGKTAQLVPVTSSTSPLKPSSSSRVKKPTRQLKRRFKYQFKQRR